MEGYEAAGVFGDGGDHLVPGFPVQGAYAEVDAVGGVLGKGDVLRGGPEQARRCLPRPGVRRALPGVELRALQVGRAGAEVVGLAGGLDSLVGRRAAAAGVQVGVVVCGEGREQLAGEGLVFDFMLLPGCFCIACIIASLCKVAVS